jgi:hypothetical protein
MLPLFCPPLPLLSILILLSKSNVHTVFSRTLNSHDPNLSKILVSGIFKDHRRAEMEVMSSYVLITADLVSSAYLLALPGFLTMNLNSPL